MAIWTDSDASDIASALLDYYVRGKALSQTTQKKPLLRILNATKKTFPGGGTGGNEGGAISTAVQGAYIEDTYAPDGFHHDDALEFRRAENLLRAHVHWKEIHFGLRITWTELKQDGITVTDSGKTTDHSEAGLVRLTSLLENRLDDFGESWSRGMNKMFWKDGTQASAIVPGILALLPDADAGQTIGGLAVNTYTWWKARASLNILSSPENQTLCNTLTDELVQLQRYGGKPNAVLCGSTFLSKLAKEVRHKGMYSVKGFTDEGSTDVGMARISLEGLGTFEYDPTLDDLGRQNFCYALDTTKLRLRPMENEENRILSPTRPYNYLVFLKSMLWTGGMEVIQRNCQGVYSVS